MAKWNLLKTLALILLALILCSIWHSSSLFQSSSNSFHDPWRPPLCLDVNLHNSAYKAIQSHHFTGDGGFTMFFLSTVMDHVHDATSYLHPNLRGIKVGALMLSHETLARTDVVKRFREFDLPKGIVVEPEIDDVMLVHQDLGKLSDVYYPVTRLLPGFVPLSPVLGLVAYDGGGSASDLVEVRAARGEHVRIRFQDVRPVPHGLVVKCIVFDVRGSVHVNRVVSSGNDTCFATQLGHFVLAAVAPGSLFDVPSVHFGETVEIPRTSIDDQATDQLLFFPDAKMIPDRLALESTASPSLPDGDTFFSPDRPDVVFDLRSFGMALLTLCFSAVLNFICFYLLCFLFFLTLFYFMILVCLIYYRFMFEVKCLSARWENT